MHIAIYETVHFENIATLLRLFDTNGNRITVFCDEQAYSLAAVNIPHPKKFTWILRNSATSRRQFVRQLFSQFKNDTPDIFYINTLSDNFISLTRLLRRYPQVRSIATLHALNAYFSPQLKFNLRRIVRVAGKWILRRTIKEYSIQSSVLLPAARKWMDPRIPIHVVPGAVYLPHALYESTLQPLHLVVPGSVDERRRNYEQLNAWLLQVDKKKIALKITFLGATASEFGKHMLQIWQSLKLINIKLHYFDTDMVPQETYNQVLEEADFIFNPSVVETVLEDGAVEIYGQTVNSGVFADAIRYAKPLIIPAAIQIDPILHPCSFRYDQLNDISDLLQSIHTDPKRYLNWIHAAQESAEHFTVEQIRYKNPELFLHGPSVTRHGN